MLLAKRVLVTGGTGFLGRVLCRKLFDRGIKVMVPTHRRIIEPYGNIEYLYNYDLTNSHDVDLMYKVNRPDVVIHLAAEVGGIGANMNNPGRFFYANMAMGLNMIEGARLHGVEKFVQLGTVCAYPKNTEVPFKEDDLWKGYPEETNAPYGVAKKALLVMLQAYRQQYGLNGIFLLPVNLYGPGDNFDLTSSHVIPALIRKCVEAKELGFEEIECWGTGEVSREFLYVDDCAEGIIAAVNSYNEPEPVNIGSGSEIKICDLVGIIAKVVGFEGSIVWDEEKPDGQPRRCLDTSRARSQFEWEAVTSLRDGLTETIKWYIQNFGRRDG